MVWIVIALYMCYSGIRLYVALLEIGHVKKAKALPPVILSAQNYEKAAEYKIATQKFALVSIVYETLLFMGWVGFGIAFVNELVVFENALLHSVVVVMLFIAMNYLLMLPFEIYQTFGLDKAFGFSTIDGRTFLLDQIKASGMFLVFGGAFFWAMSAIMAYFTYWWMYGFLFSLGVILCINMIYPIFIVPMFNKLTPLEDESLKSSIEALLKRAGLKSSGVFSLDASKRDNRLNAYFGGLGSSKRVVLFDTLIAKLEKQELLAVLGHELGHFKHKDILKNIASSAVMLFVMFALFGNLPQTLFDALHVKKEAGSVMILFLLLSPLVLFIFMPLFGLVSRYNEYRADAYGSECESKEALCSALVKLADENRSFPYAHPLSIVLYFTHPPLLQRLEKLGMPLSKGDA